MLFVKSVYVVSLKVYATLLPSLSNKSVMGYFLTMSYVGIHKKKERKVLFVYIFHIHSHVCLYTLLCMLIPFCTYLNKSLCLL